MPRINLNDAPEFIYRAEEFNSQAAISGLWDGDGRYVVRSYTTAIAVIDPAAGTVTLNDCRYSNTTSRHQSAARRAAGLLAADGFAIVTLNDPDEFTDLTGHRARVRGANFRSVA
jgi:hypothetical protein